MEVKTASGIIAAYMRFMGYRGWTSFWSTVYVLPGSETDARLLRHEQCHLMQIERDGRLLFAVKYSWYALRYGYAKNPYELEAERAADGPR